MNLTLRILSFLLLQFTPDLASGTVLVVDESGEEGEGGEGCDGDGHHGGQVSRGVLQGEPQHEDCHPYRQVIKFSDPLIYFVF